MMQVATTETKRMLGDDERSAWTPKQRWVRLWKANTAQDDDKTERKPMESKAVAPSVGASAEEDLEPGEITVESSKEAMALRVRTPTTAVTSHLSPATDRAASAVSTSISPSAKIKELDAVVAVTAQLLEHAKPDVPTSSFTQAPIVKNNLEFEFELTESERNRLERRKRRKSNWDVHDPSCARSSAFPTDLHVPSLRRAHSSNFPLGRSFPRPRPFWRPNAAMPRPHPQLPPHPDAVFASRHSSTLRHSNSLPIMPPPHDRRPYPPPSRYHHTFGPAYR